MIGSYTSRPVNGQIIKVEEARGNKYNAYDSLSPPIPLPALSTLDPRRYPAMCAAGYIHRPEAWSKWTQAHAFDEMPQSC